MTYLSYYLKYILDIFALTCIHEHIPRYEQEFIRQPNELMQKVVYRGNFDADFKDFLKMRGF